MDPAGASRPGIRRAAPDSVRRRHERRCARRVLRAAHEQYGEKQGVRGDLLSRCRDTQARRRALLAKKVPEAEVDALFREQLAWDSKYLSSMKYSGKVGAFEGAGYEAKGLYRPEADCIMFTRDPVGFCRVCRRAIGRFIDQYARP